MWMMFTEAVVAKRDFFGIQMPMSSKIPRLYSKHYYKKQQTFLLKKTQKLLYNIKANSQI